MKIGLLVGILLVLTVASSCVAPKPAAPELFTHAVTIVGGEPFRATHAVYLYQGEPYRVRSITATWPGPETEPGFYKLTGCPTPEDTTYTVTVMPGGERGIITLWPGPETEITQRPADEYLEPWELPPPPPSDEFVSQLQATTPSVPLSEPVAWDTYTATVAIMRAGPFDGWWVVGETITVTMPGPKPESDVFIARTPGPEPVKVIHTLSVWTATTRAKSGFHQGWGLEIYPGIPERLILSHYPPMPPSDEYISQLLATIPSMPLSEPAPTWGQTINDTASNGEASLTYEP